MKILVIGKPLYNVILPINKNLLESDNVTIDNTYENFLDASIYVACSLAKWNIDVSYIGSICNDDIGNKIKNILENYHVDTKYLEVNYENKSKINYSLLNENTGNNIYIKQNENVYVTRYHFDLTPDYIISDGTDMDLSIACLNQFTNAKFIFLANKAVDSYINFSKRVHYVCANMDFIKYLTKMDIDINNGESLLNCYQKVNDLNKASYIIMLNNYNTLYSDGHNVKIIPNIKVNVIDNSAYEKAFLAAYVYGLINNYKIDDIAKLSNIASNLVLNKIGTIDNILDINEVFKTANIPFKESNNHETL